MWTSEVTQMIIKGIGETLYMVIASHGSGVFIRSAGRHPACRDR